MLMGLPYNLVKSKGFLPKTFFGVNLINFLNKPKYLNSLGTDGFTLFKRIKNLYIGTGTEFFFQISHFGTKH